MDTFAPSSVKALMALWPSISDLAADVGEGYETVRGWAKRGSVPVIYWPRVISGAKGRSIQGITADLLMRLHVPAADPPTPANDVGPVTSEDAA